MAIVTNVINGFSYELVICPKCRFHAYVPANCWLYCPSHWEGNRIVPVNMKREESEENYLAQQIKQLQYG